MQERNALAEADEAMATACQEEVENLFRLAFVKYGVLDVCTEEELHSCGVDDKMLSNAKVRMTAACMLASLDISMANGSYTQDYSYRHCSQPMVA